MEWGGRRSETKPVKWEERRGVRKTEKRKEHLHKDKRHKNRSNRIM